MLETKSLFEIPVYRLREADYCKQMSAYMVKTKSQGSSNLSDSYLIAQFGGEWRYNEIVGFLRFYLYGKSQIRCEFWETAAQKKVRSRKRMKFFEKRSGRYCSEQISISHSNKDLASSMKSAVAHCEQRICEKGWILDKELFDNTVDHINWQSLLV